MEPRLALKEHPCPVQLARLLRIDPEDPLSHPDDPTAQRAELIDPASDGEVPGDRSVDEQALGLLHVSGPLKVLQDPALRGPGLRLVEQD